MVVTNAAIAFFMQIVLSAPHSGKETLPLQMALSCKGDSVFLTMHLTNLEDHFVSLRPMALPWSRGSLSLSLKGFGIDDDATKRIDPSRPVIDEFKVDDVNVGPGGKLTGQLELSTVLDLDRASTSDGIVIFWKFDYGTIFGPTNHERWEKGIVYLSRRTWLRSSCGVVLYDPD